MQDYHEFLEEVLIPEDKLQTRIAELGNKSALIMPTCRTCCWSVSFGEGCCS